MPSETPKQHRAMEAAAHGSSTLGIPKSVGKEYAKADENKKEDKPKKKFDEKAAKAQVEALRKPKEPDYVEDEC